MNVLNPSLSVDCIIFGLDTHEQALKILVYERDIFPDKNSGNKNLKFPGSLVKENENLEESAYRILKEHTGLQNIFLKQFHAFGDPNRIKYDEEKEWAEKHYEIKINRVVTVAFYALIRIDKQNPDQAKIKDKLKWINIDEAHNLAFDHSHILTVARETLVQDLKFQNVRAFELLPERFTLYQLQSMYETILGQNLDKRNFRKKIGKAAYIIPLGEKQKGVAHKPAMLYGFDNIQFERSRKEITTFFI
ncbi:NUDIX domain-containing protein [Bacteroidota bacterium]